MYLCQNDGQSNLTVSAERNTQLKFRCLRCRFENSYDIDLIVRMDGAFHLISDYAIRVLTLSRIFPNPLFPIFTDYSNHSAYCHTL